MALVPLLLESVLSNSFGDILSPVSYTPPTFTHLLPRESWVRANQVFKQLERFSKQLEQELAYGVKNTNDSFEVALDCKHFKPEEISVKVVDKNNLIIEAKHEERSDDHGFISRQFTRRYLLPDNVETDKIQSQLGVDGILSIQAPKKPLGSVEGERKIPIQLTDQVTKSIEKGEKQQQQQKNEAKKELK